MKTVFSVIGALVVGFIGLVVLIAVFSSNSTHGVGDLSSNSSSASSTPYTVTVGERTYTGAYASNVGVAVLGVSSSPFLFTGLGQSQADGKFVIVQVAVTNQQNSEITMDNGLFELVSSDGTVYSSSSKSMEVGERNNLFLAAINPGLTKVGMVIFDVPSSLSLDALRFRFRGGMTGETDVLPLTVQATDIPQEQVAPANNENEQQAMPPVAPQQPSSTEPVETPPSTQPSDATTTNTQQSP
jgi:hypothetical protein